MLRIVIEGMKKAAAKEILGWRYEAPYDFYNLDFSVDSLNEFLNGTYYVLSDEENGVIGFYCSGRSAQVPSGDMYGMYQGPYLDVGLGMHPKLVGQGYGFEFCTTILAHRQTVQGRSPIRLTVATFNIRAIRLYERLGFVKKHEFRGTCCDFMTMVKESN